MRNIQLKLLSVIPLCLFALSSSYAQTTTSQQKPKSKTKVETKYDERKNETTARIGPFVIWEPLDNTISGEMNYERVLLLRDNVASLLSDYVAWQDYRTLP